MAKLISDRHSISHNEMEIYEMLEKINAKIWGVLQKEEHVYPDTAVFFEAARRNLDIILDAQKGKVFYIKPVLQRVELMLKYLRASFDQICFVLKSNLLNEIIQVSAKYGDADSEDAIAKTVTYDIFLRKYKSLPERNLNLANEVKRHRQAIGRPDPDVRELIMTKYVKHYQLYEKIYEFYWQLVCGRKLNYPMSRFMGLVRNQAIKYESSDPKELGLGLGLESHKNDGLMIYQKAADFQGINVFYSLSASGLEDHKVRDYSTSKVSIGTIFEVFGEFFQDNFIELNSLKNINTQLPKNAPKYILSANTNINRAKWEESDFNKCKIYADVLYPAPVPDHARPRLIYDHICARLLALSAKGFGVVGLYCGESGHWDEDQVFPWTEQEQKYMWYDVGSTCSSSGTMERGGWSTSRRPS